MKAHLKKIILCLAAVVLTILTGCPKVAQKQSTLECPEVTQKQPASTPEATTLLFSPATLPVGSRLEKRWEESGYIISCSARQHESGMGSMSIIGSETPTPQGHFSAWNGSDYLSFSSHLGKNWHLKRKDKSSFSVLSIDIAEYSTVYPIPVAVMFYGEKNDGTVVAISFVTDGKIDGPHNDEDFQSFAFTSDFTGIKKLYWTPGAFSLDNFKLAPSKPEQ